MLALDTIQDFRHQPLGVGIRHARRRGLNGHALRAHRRHIESVGGELLADVFENRALPRRQVHHDRHQQPLARQRPFAPRTQMLLEEHAFVGHVLIDDPQTLGVHRHNETRVHLPEWPQLPQRNRARRSFHHLRRGQSFPELRLDLLAVSRDGSSRGRFIRRDVERKPLRLRLHWSVRQRKRLSRHAGIRIG